MQTSYKSVDKKSGSNETILLVFTMSVIKRISSFSTSVFDYNVEVLQCRFPKNSKAQKIFDSLFSFLSKWRHLPEELFYEGGQYDLNIRFRRTQEQEQPNCEICRKMEPVLTLKDVSVNVETILNSVNQSRSVFLTEYHTNGHIIVSDDSESSDDGIDTDYSESDMDMD